MFEVERAQQIVQAAALPHTHLTNHAGLPLENDEAGRQNGHAYLFAKAAESTSKPCS